MSIKFEVLSKHLSKYFPSLKNFRDKYLSLFFSDTENVQDHFAYVCPLCTKNAIILLEDNTIFDTNAEFTLDHFPPEAVGGKQTILVCKKCNNEAGAKYENSLKEKINDMSFNEKTISAKAKVKSKISSVKGDYHSILKIRKDGKFEINFKASDKIHAPLLDQWLENSKVDNDWTAEITIPFADETKVLKAILKSAYLFCFNYWGYDFVYSHTGNQIRRILHDDAEYPLKNPSFWFGNIAKSGKILKFPLGVCNIVQPREVKCFLVNIHLINKETKYDNIVGILIPGPSKEDWDDLKRIQLIFSDNPTMNITLNHVVGFGILDGIFNGYTKSWDTLKSL